MKILLICDISGYTTGGTTTEIKYLIAGLQERGHQVAIAIDSIELLEREVTHFAMTVTPGILMHEQVTAALREFQPEVVHVIAMSSRGVRILGPILNGRAWLMTIHALPPHERKLQLFHGNDNIHYLARALRFLPNSLAWRWIFKTQNIPKIIVHSNFVRNAVIAKGGKRDFIEIIPLPFIEYLDADVSALEAIHNSKKPVLSTVAGIAHTKGQHDVIKALHTLAKEFPGIKYHIIGEVRDTSYLSYLKQLINSLGLENNVTIHERISSDAKNAILKSTDVYVQPSHEEGFCFAYFEAAALVQRLVGTDTGAIAAASEFDIGARVVPPRQPAKIALAVSDLIGQNIQDSLMQNRKIRLSKAFSLSGYITMHLTEYERMAASRPTLSP